MDEYIKKQLQNNTRKTDVIFHTTAAERQHQWQFTSCTDAARQNHLLSSSAARTHAPVAPHRRRPDQRNSTWVASPSTALPPPLAAGCCCCCCLCCCWCCLYCIEENFFGESPVRPSCVDATTNEIQERYSCYQGPGASGWSREPV